MQDVVKDSNLRGRGGAGFPTGAKWSFVPLGDGAPRPKYLVCNADEMEPGTFKDRLLLEGNPHQLIEGMLIAAYAIDADHAYIFLRGEYRLAAQRLQKAIAEAYAAGYLGRDILGSGYELELGLHTQRRPLHLRRGDRAAQRARRQARDPAGQAAVPAGRRACGASRPSSTTSRRCATCRTSSSNGAEWFKALCALRGRRHQALRRERPA